MQRVFLAIICVVMVDVMAAPVLAAPIEVVAAENVYGEFAERIGGKEVVVKSIISAQGQDPHAFEASPSVARAIATADVIILNGSSYDDWMIKLSKIASNKQRLVINVSELIKATPGANPHFWYRIQTMVMLGEELAKVFGSIDIAHKDEFVTRAETITGQLETLQERVRNLRLSIAGIPVTATEPVLGYMSDDLGLSMQNNDFQTAIMNETEPSASEIISIEESLRQRKVAALFYNTDIESKTVKRLKEIARQAMIPIIGVSELQPAGFSYEAWMSSVLDKIEQALSVNRP